MPRLLKEACLRGTRLRQDERVAAREARGLGRRRGGAGPLLCSAHCSAAPLPSADAVVQHGRAGLCLPPRQFVSDSAPCALPVLAPHPDGNHKSPFSYQKFSPKFFCLTLRHMYRALNIIKKIKLILQFRCTRRDESFEPN